MRRTAVLLSLVLVMAAMVGAQATISYDDFADAGVISSLPFGLALDNTGATREVDEPQPSCGLMDATLWFSYTPTSTHKLRVDTLDFGTIDTVLAVYTGTGLDSLTEVACNEDHRKTVVDAASESLLYVEATAGTTYMIQVGGYDALAGPIQLNAAFEAPLPTSCSGCASFDVHDVPEEFDTRAGEVSLAVDERTNETVFLMLGHSLKVDWDENGQPTWADTTGLLLDTTNDPILEADP